MRLWNYPSELSNIKSISLSLLLKGILSVLYNHHKIFGDTKIKFFDDSEPETEDLQSEHHADMVYNIDTSTNENYCTFIVGDNDMDTLTLRQSGRVVAFLTDISR